MTIESRLAEIRARAENAASFRDERGVPTLTGFSIPDLSNVIRTDLPALLAAVEAVMALHKCLTFPDDGIGEPTACGHCDNETWPCPTVRDITAALEVQG